MSQLLSPSSIIPSQRNILFLYWGRYGLNAFVSEVMKAMSRRQDVNYALLLSRYNSDLAAFAWLDNRLLLADIFKLPPGALNLTRLLSLRRAVAELVKERGITDAVTLMPHVWSFAVAPVFRRAGARYHTIIHDAARHPGDRTGLMLPLLLRDTLKADTVFTLSAGVAEEIRKSGLVVDKRLKVLFHPPSVRIAGTHTAPARGEAWRLLFLGRVLPYKGLPLFVELLARLRAEGRAVEATVMGEGRLGPEKATLNALGANIINRWVDEAEIAAALLEHHVLVLSHVEASQSGVAAMALGVGLPVLATPVGGLKEQVRHGQTGLLAREVSVTALAEIARDLMDTPDLYAQLTVGAAAARETNSADAFVDALLSSLTRRGD
jgi:glycosyltransferase involved in cell wall biosynthesis